MLSITQELRHFETIFLKEDNGHLTARIFDLIEELPFAGHPIIGAACALHRKAKTFEKRVWEFGLENGREVRVVTDYQDGRYIGTLDQGRPRMIACLDDHHKATIAKAFSLDLNDIADLPLEVISTGLKYLVVPVESGLETARISIPDLEQKLESFGAEFAYLFDVNSLEGRHWNNDGVMEDVATGSAAGVIGAYALKHALVDPDKSFTLRQGHFMGRPSEIIVTVSGTPENVERVTVAGAVAFVGRGEVIAP
jgi:PhzF family phenazine biosynthesis protein